MPGMATKEERELTKCSAGDEEAASAEASIPDPCCTRRSQDAWGYLKDHSPPTVISPVSIREDDARQACSKCDTVFIFSSPMDA